MGVKPTVRLGSADPGRWNTSPDVMERRLEAVFSGAYRTDTKAKEQGAQLAQTTVETNYQAAQIAQLSSSTSNSIQGLNDRLSTLENNSTTPAALNTRVTTLETDLPAAEDRITALEAKPNVTSVPNTTTGDHVLKLDGTRGIYGQRDKTTTGAPAAFTVWTEAVTFATAYPTPPVVVLSPETFDTDAISASVQDVTTTGFTARLTCAVAKNHMRLHFHVWGAP